jgi:ABC-type dipeptide/oligopeptide/nickel transport system permease subunit
MTEHVSHSTEMPASATSLARPLQQLDRASMRKSRGFWAETWFQFRKNKVSMVALGVTLLIILCVLCAPLISKYITGFTPTENHLPDKLSHPFSNGYILGSDGNGRDVLTRLVYGGRASLAVAGLAALGILLIGSTLGSMAGYFGRWPDTIISRGVDMLLSIPVLPLLILITSLYQPGIFMLSVFIAMTSWGGVTRLIRGEVLKIKHREYIEAAKLVGGSNFRIISRHIIPNVIPIVIVWLSLVIPSLILTEAILSYLGLGVRAPTPSWGNMLQESKQFFRTNWTLVFIPGFTIYIAALSINLVGVGLRDALDPHLRNK